MLKKIRKNKIAVKDKKRQSEYFSGNIREKIEVIDAYIKNIEQEIVQYKEMAKKSENEAEINDTEKYLEEENQVLRNELLNLNYQKDKLLEVMPKELEASDITVRMETTWIPEKDYKSFMFHLLKTSASNRWKFLAKWR